LTRARGGTDVPGDAVALGRASRNVIRVDHARARAGSGTVIVAVVGAASVSSVLAGVDGYERQNADGRQ
jgi:hypothetical protein